MHQDGLVHISEMANDFVEDPMNLVKPGDIVTVRVISVDAKRNRIGFSSNKGGRTNPRNAKGKPAAKQKPEENKIGSLGALLKQAGLK